MPCTTPRRTAADRTPPSALPARTWHQWCRGAGRALRRLGRGLSLTGLLLSTTPVLAQESTTTTVVTSSRSYLLDGAIVIGLCGLAVYVVCRSSRRS